MKFSIPSDALQAVLQTVNGAVPSKSTLPILESILFERDGDTLRLYATDLEISILEEVDVEFDSDAAEKEERIAIPAKRLLDTVRALPSLPVTLSTDSDLNVTLTTDQGRYKMVGYDGGDYPAPPSLEDAQSIETTGEQIRHAVNKTAFAVSKDALRPAMMGVLFELETDQARFVATDGHRLIKLTTKGLSADEAMTFIVPEKALDLAAKAVPGAEAACTLRVADKYIEFDYGNRRVIGRLIDETYPNYESVIPIENEKNMTVSTDALLAAVGRVALYSSSTTHQIRLSLSEDAVEVAAEDIERASEAKERVLCEYDGEPMEIGFNSVYLQEVLKNLSSDDAAFEFSTPNRAGIVRPKEESDDEEMLMLIMPVILNSYARA